jgi:hypothetical protein
MISPSSPNVIGCGRWASCVDAKVGQLLRTEGVVLQHPADGMHDRERRIDGHRLIEGPHATAAGVSGIAVVLLERALATRHDDVARVDDDDVLAGVDVLRELRTVLAAQHTGDVRGKTAERLSTCIHEEPALLELLRLGLVREHRGHAASSSGVGS